MPYRDGRCGSLFSSSRQSVVHDSEGPRAPRGSSFPGRKDICQQWFASPVAGRPRGIAVAERQKLGRKFSDNTIERGPELTSVSQTPLQLFLGACSVEHSPTGVSRPSAIVCAGPIESTRGGGSVHPL